MLTFCRGKCERVKGGGGGPLQIWEGVREKKLSVRVLGIPPPAPHILGLLHSIISQ